MFAEFMVASLPGADDISQQLLHVKQMERMLFEPGVRHGFEHDTMEAKIRWFLQFTAGGRFEMMMAAIELALRLAFRAKFQTI